MDKTNKHKNPTEFPNGIIDVFKENQVYDNNSKYYKRKGEIIHKMSNDIGKKILSIEGSLSASNYIEIPNPDYKKSLNYCGKYYYIQMKAHEDKKFSFQFVFTLNGIPVKFNFKYPLAEIKFTQTNAYIIDIPLSPDTQFNLNPFNEEYLFNSNSNILDSDNHLNHQKRVSCFSFWSIYRFNPAEFINEYFSDEFKTFGGISSDNLILKSFLVYSNIAVRGLFISNSLYEKTLPSQMSFKKEIEKSEKLLLHCNLFDVNLMFKSNIEEIYNDNQINNQNNEQQDYNNTNLSHNKNIMKKSKQEFSQYSQLNYNDSMKKQTEKFSKQQEQLQNTLLKNHNDEIEMLEKRAKEIKSDNFSRSLTPSSHKGSVADKVKEIQNNSFNKSISRSGPTITKENLDLKEINSDVLRKHMEEANQEALDKRIAVRNVFKQKEEKKVALLPDPIMNLKYILGFTGNICPSIKYNNVNDKKDVLFPSGNMMINFDYSNLKQKFFLGHSKPITACAITHDYNVLFSAQEGKNAIIRIWKIETTRCVKMLTTPYERISSMSISKNNSILTTVGLESYNKELIIIWDISNINDIKVKIRQGSHFNIAQIRFSPYDQSVLATCGKENIKFWRIKNDHLGGKAVVLNQYARNSFFNCLDYDNPFMGDNMSKGRLFVGNNMGCIFQVSCNTMELDAVYKIHDTPITSLAVNDAFCATGSEDGYLRVWPIDFSEFLIEAKHDSPVITIDIAFDALDIIVGTKNGSIGTLNIQSKQYKTLLRSPPGKVLDMAVHPEGNYLFTIEENSSVRVWDVENKSESFQFVSVKDPPTYVAAPKRALIFACGFVSGSLKVFDIENTTVLYECRAFNQPISKIAFIQNSSLLVSMSIVGHLSLHDVSAEFIQIKLIKIDSPCINADLAVPLEDNIFATIGPESNSVLVWNTSSYGLRNRIPIEGNICKKLSFITSKLISVIFENGNVTVYSLIDFEGIVVKELNYLHSGGTALLNVSKNYKFLMTGGEEGMLKVLDTKMLYKNYSSYQQYIGHSNAIKSLIIIEHKSIIVTVSENDGIFFWNFLGDLTFSETDLLNDLDNLAVYGPIYFKNSKSANNNIVNQSQLLKKTHLEKAYNNESQIYDDTNNKSFNDTSINKKSNLLRTQIKNTIATKSEMEVDQLVMMPIENDDNDNNTFNYTKGSFKPDMSTNMLQSDSFLKMTGNMNVKEEFENKLFFESKFMPEKVNSDILTKDNSNKLNKKFVLGMGLSTRKNLLYNPYKRYFVFSVNNKVVVEFLEVDRTQLILEDSYDEISSLAFSPEYKILATTVGTINRGINAPIYLYETENFTLIKKLNFHFKGIQALQFSQCGNYMVSIGNKDERSICVWNTYNYTVLDSKSLKFSVFDIKVEKNYMINSITNKSVASISSLKKTNIFYFVTCGVDVVSFWRLDTNAKLEGYHIKIEDLTRDRSEFITSIELTPLIEKTRTSFVMLGTSSGSILILEKEKKQLIKKYLISQTPLTSIHFSLERLVITSDSPVIYSWMIPFNKIDEEAVFDFMKETKENQSSVLFLDRNIRAVDFTVDGREGLVATDNGGVFYVNIKENSNIKIINSHLNNEINCVTTKDKDQMISCSDDGTIRAWTLDSFDQKFEFCYYGNKEICDYIELNSHENIALVLFKNNTNFNNNNDTNINHMNITNNNNNNVNEVSFNNQVNQTILNTSQNQFNPQGIQTFIRVYNMTKLKSLGKIILPENGIYINNFKLIFNGNGVIVTTYQDKVFVLDIQNWDPLSILYTETNSTFMPKNQQFKHIDCLDINNNSSICSMAFSNGTIVIINIKKVNSKIETEIIDKFNLFEYHISKSEDLTTAELFKNLTKYRTDYISNADFSRNWDGVLFAFHECLQFLFLRNYSTKEIYRRIPLNYFPLSIAFSGKEEYISIGTKEGVVLFITRNDDDINSGFNLDTFKGHFSGIKSVSISSDSNQVISSSHSEIMVWGIN